METRNILFADIETVPQYESYEKLPEGIKELWKKKAESILKADENETLEGSYKRAGLYAEFGKIVCISCGLIKTDENGKEIIKTQSFFHADEYKLLSAFANMLEKCPNLRLCAHNGKTFDFPFIFRRMIINGIRIPAILNIQGKKPWEITHIDTMEMWKCGDFKATVSLNLLAAVLGIPSPKDDIDGSQVADVYWVEKDIERIVKYCSKDVVTLAKVYSRLANLLQPINNSLQPLV